MPPATHGTSISAPPVRTIIRLHELPGLGFSLARSASFRPWDRLQPLGINRLATDFAQHALPSSLASSLVGARALLFLCTAGKSSRRSFHSTVLRQALRAGSVSRRNRPSIAPANRIIAAAHRLPAAVRASQWGRKHGNTRATKSRLISIHVTPSRGLIRLRTSNLSRPTCFNVAEFARIRQDSRILAIQLPPSVSATRPHALADILTGLHDSSNTRRSSAEP